MATPGEEIFITRLDQEQLRKTSMSAQMAAEAKPKEEKTWDQIVPPLSQMEEGLFQRRVKLNTLTSTLGYRNQLYGRHAQGA
jgi:hypothetical protein